MNVIIPMAGMGKRMRPHTLLTPKPLLKIAGKSIVQRIVEDLSSSTGKIIDEVHFVIGNFGKEVETDLKNIAENIGAKGFIHYQEEPLGTAHAVFCASSGLSGEVVVAFADTLFIGNFSVEDSDQAIIWTMKVDKPESYGVVITDDKEYITDFAEKPEKFVSDKAIIGIYYFRDGEALNTSLKDLIENKRMVKGEYQLTDVLKDLMESGTSFKCKTIDKWLDCGNKEQFLNSAKSIIAEHYSNENHQYRDSTIGRAVYIGKNVVIENSIISDYVSIEDNTRIIDSKIFESCIGSDSIIRNSDLKNSLIGTNCSLEGCNGIVNLGDYCKYEDI